MSLQKQSILFINGLDKTVNENMLYQLFNDYSVSYIKIAKDHNTRESFGYAFIGFKNNAKAEEAIKKLNYSKLAKKTLRISWYNREPGNFRNKLENNIFVKKIPKEVTAKEFDEYFRQFGNIVSAKLAEDEEGESMGYGFVLYDSEEGAKKAIKECHGKEWRGKKLFVAQFQKNRPKQPPKYNNIYVRNIPKSWSEDDIKKYFSKYGEIGSMIVRIPEADKLKKELPEEKRKHILEHKYAFVCFKSLDGPAKKAVAKVPYLKIDDEEYNKKIEELSNKAKEAGIGEDDIYKCACFILDNNAEEKINNKDEFDKLQEESYDRLIESYDDPEVYEEFCVRFVDELCEKHEEKSEPMPICNDENAVMPYETPKVNWTVDDYIPIEWLKKWAETNSNGEWSVEYRTVFNGILKDWKKENETNRCR